MAPATSGLTWFAGWDRPGRAKARPGPGGGPARESGAGGAVGAEGAVECYDLLAVAARGFRPPQVLTVAQAEGADPQHPPRDHEPEPGDLHPGATELRQARCLLYERIAETNPRQRTPDAIYLLGVDPPAGATDEDLAEFNDFYTNVHLREVAERRHALRAVRYELVRPVKAPPKGAPRFLAVYEVDEASAAQRRHVGPPYSPGPAVWQGHRTRWRLWYRARRAP